MIRESLLTLVVLALLGAPTLMMAEASAAPESNEATQGHRLLLESQHAFDTGDFLRAKALARQALHQELDDSDRSDAKAIYRQAMHDRMAEAHRVKSKVMASDALSVAGDGHSLDERQALYSRYSIQNLDGLSGRVDGWVYHSAQTSDYYAYSGCSPAAALVQESMDLSGAGVRWQIWGSVTGAALGGVGGYIYERQTQAYLTDIAGVITVFHIVAGAVCGAAGGAIVGGVQNWRLHRQAEDRFRLGSETFNQSLRRRLDLTVVPAVGGAMGQLSLTF